MVLQPRVPAPVAGVSACPVLAIANDGPAARKVTRIGCLRKAGFVVNELALTLARSGRVQAYASEPSLVVRRRVHQLEGLAQEVLLVIKAYTRTPSKGTRRIANAVVLASVLARRVLASLRPPGAVLRRSSPGYTAAGPNAHGRL